jgi:hypothetical protein
MQASHFVPTHLCINIELSPLIGFFWYLGQKIAILFTSWQYSTTSTFALFDPKKVIFTNSLQECHEMIVTNGILVFVKNFIVH